MSTPLGLRYSYQSPSYYYPRTWRQNFGKIPPHIILSSLFIACSQSRGSKQWRPRGYILATSSQWRPHLNMLLYSLTIQPPTAISHAIIGQFPGTKEQLILSTSSSRLTLLRPDSRLGNVQTLVSHDLFSIIRSVASFRLAGSSKAMYSPFVFLGWFVVREARRVCILFLVFPGWFVVRSVVRS